MYGISLILTQIARAVDGYQLLIGLNYSAVLMNEKTGFWEQISIFQLLPFHANASTSKVVEYFTLILTLTTKRLQKSNNQSIFHKLNN